MADDWNTLPTEMKIAVITQLLDSQDALDSLHIFAQTSHESHTLAQDSQVWKRLLQIFFPATELYHKEAFTLSPRSLFKKLYLQVNELLKVDGLNWKIYQDYVAKKDTATTLQQQRKMFILMWISGIDKNIDINNLSKQEIDYLCLQSVLTGRTEIIAQRIAQENIILLSSMLKKIFKGSAQQGNIQLAETLLKMAALVLAKDTQIEAIHTALINHQDLFALHCLNKILSSISAYSLMPLLKTALEQGCDEFFIKTLKSCGNKLSTFSKNELFQFATAMGRENAISYFLQYEITLSNMSKNKALLTAVQNNHPRLVKLLILHLGENLTPYNKKAILRTEAFKNCGISVEQLMANRYREIDERLQTLANNLDMLSLSDENAEAITSYKNYTPHLQTSYAKQTLQRSSLNTQGFQLKMQRRL